MKYQINLNLMKITQNSRLTSQKVLNNTIFMIVSDHGGINKGHGGTTMDEMEAPLIFFGPGVKKGYKIEQPVVRYDTAPTIAYIFGAKTPDVWRGRAIVEIFE